MSLSSLSPGAPTGRSGPPIKKKSVGLVIALAFLALVFDGYDLVVYGTIVDSILAYEKWGLTTAVTGAMNSLALLGMALGSLMVGYLTDLVGRRRVLIGAVAFFSILMLATAAAPTPELFSCSASCRASAWAASSRPPWRPQSSSRGRVARISTTP